MVTIRDSQRPLSKKREQEGILLSYPGETTVDSPYKDRPVGNAREAAAAGSGSGSAVPRSFAVATPLQKESAIPH